MVAEQFPNSADDETPETVNDDDLADSTKDDYTLDPSDPFLNEEQYNSDDSELLPNDEPLYQNQEADPEVANMMFLAKFNMA